MHELFSLVTLPLSIYKEIVGEILRWNEIMSGFRASYEGV